jgi:Skp family chaperone for outer membrane proteins
VDAVLPTISGLILCVATLGCASTQSTSDPVPVVDMRRALMECRDGQEARSDLMLAYGRSQALLDRHRDELIAIVKQIKADRDRGVATGDREAAVQRDTATLQAEYAKLQRELAEAETRRAAPVQARLEQVLAQLAATRHYGNVRRTSPAPKDDGRTIDITLDLIRAANAEPPLPAAP